MEYDAYGRPIVRGEEPGYFETNSSRDYSNYEPRDRSPQKTSNTRERYSPPMTDKMSSTTEASDTQKGPKEDVSPEVIAAITEKVKREIMEHLKQTGTVEEPAKLPPLQRAPSKSSSSSSPPPTPPATRRVYTPPSPTTSKQAMPPPPEPSYKNPPLSPLEKPLGVRFSDRNLPTRPVAPRTFSTAELSTIDQKWGRLFDRDGVPTQRLGQFLRGLANHIIEDFQPKKSIVVPPSKMAQYYSNHPIDNEPHPFLTIFRAQSNEHISVLYQDLGCQHHLIQEDSRSAPIVPALTALGFAHWMTINILAFPEEEWKRLEKVVLAMPINADGQMIDGKPERLPKQISRHLLPAKEDRKSRKLLEEAILDFLDDLGTTSRRKDSISSPPPISRNSSATQQQSKPRPPVEIHQKTTPKESNAKPLVERERNPYAGAPSASDTSSSNDNQEPTVKIERDRQPYTAQPGNGKVYHSDNINANDNNSQSRTDRTTSTSNDPRLNRTNSTSSRPKDRDRDRDSEYPEHHRTQSSASQNYTPSSRPVPSGRPRRPSSPPIKNFSQSTPDDIHSSKYGPNPAFSPPPLGPGNSYPNNPMFPPPPSGPPPRRGGVEDTHRYELNTPRDAERLDRLQEERAMPPYERGSVSLDPRDSGRGAPAEDWYRDRPRGSEYNDGAHRRY